MSLRSKIQAAIESANGDNEKSAIAVCVVLEDEIGLSDNGWFDDDEIVNDAISEFYENN